jgi:hypothetical protein
MGAQKKPSLLGLYGNPTPVSPEKKAVEDLRSKLNGLLESDPRLARKAALILELWMRQKTR